MWPPRTASRDCASLPWVRLSSRSPELACAPDEADHREHQRENDDDEPDDDRTEVGRDERVEFVQGGLLGGPVESTAARLPSGPDAILRAAMAKRTRYPSRSAAKSPARRAARPASSPGLDRAAGDTIRPTRTSTWRMEPSAQPRRVDPGGGRARGPARSRGHGEGEGGHRGVAAASQPSASPPRTCRSPATPTRRSRSAPPTSTPTSRGT